MTPLEQLQADFKNELALGTRSTLEIVDEYCAKAFKLGYEESESDYLTNSVHSTESPCPLTNSSHEKALVRVISKDVGDKNTFDQRDFIQVLCTCGQELSINEIKSK